MKKHKKEKYIPKVIQLRVSDKNFIEDTALKLGMSSNQLIRNIVADYRKLCETNERV